MGAETVHAPAAPAGPSESDPMVPRVHRVVGRRRETADVVTLSLEPLEGPPAPFVAGQFNMLTGFGVGEAAISISSSPRQGGPIEHTVRAVGPVTAALCATQVGDLVGLRGPFGSNWPLDEADGGDVVVVAGGIGLAPLRGAVSELVARRRKGGGRIVVLVGAREPGQIVFAEDLEAWAAGGARVETTVDMTTTEWHGHVGVVTTLLADAEFDPPTTTVMMCGPEIMMRFSARALVEMGVDPGRIVVSLERNMQCGLGWCGHCQLGPFLLCRDGPIMPYGAVVARLLSERER